LIKVLIVPISFTVEKGHQVDNTVNYIGDSKINRMPYIRTWDYLNLIALIGKYKLSI